MSSLGEALYQKGIDEGFERGFQIGFEEGCNDFLQLLINLRNQGRMADFDKALLDKEAREQFYKEFGILE